MSVQVFGFCVRELPVSTVRCIPAYQGLTRAMFTRVIKYLQEFATQRKLEYKQDSTGNMVIKRPGSGGGEGAAVVVIQVFSLICIYLWEMRLFEQDMPVCEALLQEACRTNYTNTPGQKYAGSY